MKLGIGWVISAVGIMQLPLWATYAVYKQKGNTLMEVQFNKALLSDAVNVKKINFTEN